MASTPNRRRIRDLTHRGDRWIVSLAAQEQVGGLWRGSLAFFLDGPPPSAELHDGLVIEAFDFDELVAQASALSPDELERRLTRVLKKSPV